MDSLAYWTAIVLVAFAQAWSGVDNGLLYQKTGGRRANSRLPRWIGPHEAEIGMMWPVFGIAFLLGADPVHLFGSALVGGLFFKGFINLSIGRPFIDPDESSDVDGDGYPGWTVFGKIRVPALHGYWRVVGVLVGVLLWLYRPVLGLF